MRSRQEIEKLRESGNEKFLNYEYDWVKIELLLDIRDLLIKQDKGKGF